MSAMERRDCSRKRYRFLNLYCILEIKAAIMSSSIVVVIISIKWLCEKMKQVAWTDESAEDYSAILLTAQMCIFNFSTETLCSKACCASSPMTYI